jgi:hydrogenase-4 component E
MVTIPIILIILFTGTLAYVGLAWRLANIQKMLIVQGILLFGIAFLELHEINIINLIFILIETLVVKAFIVPIYLMRIVGKEKARLPLRPKLSQMMTLGLITLGIALSFVLANSLHDAHLRIIYFTASVSAVLTGLLVMLNLRKAISHVMGYIILENGLFLLALAVGSEMPMTVNIAVIFDLVFSVLVLGVLLSRISQLHPTTEVDHLSLLKD